MKNYSVDLAGAFSKLAPPVSRVAAVHYAIRLRDSSFKPRRAACVRQATRVSEYDLAAAENRYEAGATLREIASDVGVSRERLAALLRSRGIKLRRSSPSDAEVDEMVRLYEGGESLERVGARLGFSAGTVRNWLLSRGVAMRDCHGRER
ncbi:hypothetical protein K8W59_02715 [Nocardioides rotundus]|uniref:hypothetical protein n=1 Tax=Nocardioides rotundus TaxID=1774216 RepID=UPI001CC17A8A|nr:hypothetical protein [Nocardioides rotundus]UAL32145.1 hypothetical protein K8W59_02715 [Nocardioides rotundus]